MKNHPNRGKLVNAIGTKSSVQCRIQTDMIFDNTIFLLCTDGMYKYCPDKQIKSAQKRSREKKHGERIE